MKTRALDSWAVIEWMLDRNPAADVVEDLFAEAERGNARLLMSGLNMGEVYYYLAKRRSVAVAEHWRETLPSIAITIEAPKMDEIWTAALAQKYDCPLLTGDPELRTVNGLQLDWIGP